jgi:hypothetical protein
MPGYQLFSGSASPRRRITSGEGCWAAAFNAAALVGGGGWFFISSEWVGSALVKSHGGGCNDGITTRKKHKQTNAIMIVALDMRVNSIKIASVQRNRVY